MSCPWYTFCSTHCICFTKQKLKYLIESLELDNLHNGSKDFLLGNSHIVLDVGENSWLNEETVSLDLVTAGNESSTLLLTRFDQAQNLFKLFAIDLWT